ncbi:TFIIB-type zinc ribbon-containing protein [uncultured Salinibacterium sp.]|uniref:TFIIB-type zinc ribbon-containing protein n=1 Tax=uncultured Salinibacterium sp. TaxID=459274 RepID=UPI0030DDB123|tara:strand:+ start:63074 stop:64420 length:1347 start_codon:yes stop_codon:yes gene_type:complete
MDNLNADSPHTGHAAPVPEAAPSAAEVAPPAAAEAPPTPPASVDAGGSAPVAQEDAGGDTPRIVRTDEGAEDGLTKCARCGSTEISLNVASGNLRCGFCRFEWTAENALEAFDLNGDIGKLSGIVVGSGSSDIIPSVEEVLTFKCSACGAEVVIDTNNSTQARCHWCRNTLSMNQQVDNGAVPDMILPFTIEKASAVERIAKFVGKRKFFAHPEFRREFNASNVMGVYLPYMVVDINAHGRFTGQGEHQTRSYTVKVGDNDQRRYDADRYSVMREFDIHVNDLTVESSSDRLDQDTSKNSNNIINTIMPFDIENSVRYDSNYLSGFTSERRDSNLDQLTPIAHTQAADVTRHRVNDTLKFYDRGVRWDSEEVDVRGQRWVSAYLPVWLYSYQQKKSGGKTFLHYVAVNGRTGETMGSVPVHQGKLLLVSGIVQLFGTVIGLVLVAVGV